jgi:phosphatidyl-myo-inositol dimannoside synthase
VAAPEGLEVLLQCDLVACAAREVAERTRPECLLGQALEVVNVEGFGRNGPDRVGRVGALLVTHGFPPDVGGIQTYLHARCLATPEEITVAAPARPCAEAFDRRQPFPVLRWPSPSHLDRPMQLVGPLLEGRKVEDVEWIECGQALPVGVPAYLLARMGGVPYAIWAHGQELLRAREHGFERAARALLARARAVFANSCATADLAREFGAERVEVLAPGPLPGGPDPSRAEGPGLRERYDLGERPVVLSVSRLVPRKAHDVLLRAIARARERRPDLAVAVVGEGPDRARLEGLVAELGLQGDAFLPGRLAEAELSQTFAEATLFALLSHHEPELTWWEGFGIVFREAGRFGLPVVGTRAGGIPDAVEDGVNGLLVEPDGPDAAAQAILRIVEDPSLGRRLGMEGRRLSETQPDWTIIRKVMTA